MDETMLLHNVTASVRKGSEVVEIWKKEEHDSQNSLVLPLSGQSRAPDKKI